MLFIHFILYKHISIHINSKFKCFLIFLIVFFVFEKKKQKKHLNLYAKTFDLETT